MELKKNPKYDLNNKMGMLRNLGLTISLLAVIVVFEMPARGDDEIIDLGVLDNEAVEVIDVPPTTQPPPPPPKMLTVPEIVEVPDEEEIEEDIEIDLDVEVTEITVVEDLIFAPVDMNDEKADEVFVIVEEQPSFPGGMKAFYELMGDKIRYPSMARRTQVQGRVFIEFIVEKNGVLTGIKVVKGIGAGCDEEAIRVLKTVPRFNPGKQRGVPVRVKMVLPIYFRLANI